MISLFYHNTLVWCSGAVQRSRYGSAAELAERGYIAVYPVLGWWKERANLERWGKQARYALIVSIKTTELETDIYTPVKNIISVQAVV